MVYLRRAACRAFRRRPCARDKCGLSQSEQLSVDRVVVARHLSHEAEGLKPAGRSIHSCGARVNCPSGRGAAPRRVKRPALSGRFFRVKLSVASSEPEAPCVTVMLKALSSTLSQAKLPFHSPTIDRCGARAPAVGVVEDPRLRSGQPQLSQASDSKPRPAPWSPEPPALHRARPFPPRPCLSATAPAARRLTARGRGIRPAGVSPPQPFMLLGLDLRLSVSRQAGFSRDIGRRHFGVELRQRRACANCSRGGSNGARAVEARSREGLAARGRARAAPRSCSYQTLRTAASAAAKFSPDDGKPWSRSKAASACASASRALRPPGPRHSRDRPACAEVRRQSSVPEPQTVRRLHR